MDVKKILIQQAQRFADKPAIIFKDTSTTFSGLKDVVFRLANAFSSLGIKKGDKVAIYLPNCPEYIFSYFALFSIGAVVVPLDFMLTEKEITGFISHSDTIVLIAKEKKGVDLNAVKNSCTLLQKIVLHEDAEGATPVVQDYVAWNSLLQASAEIPAQKVADTDYSSIFYTSGSTGHPKGVLLTYGHLDVPVECIKHNLQVTDKDSYLCAGVPFSHIGGLDYQLFMLKFGSTLVLMDRFNPFESLKNLQQYKVTVFCIVPAMFVAILSLKECDKFDLSALKHPVVFGAPSSPALLQRFHKLCPNAVLRNGWGMTETAAPNSYSPPDMSKLSSIGPIGLGMEAKIVDDSGKEVAVGEKGELWLRGKGIMVGYYKEEALTKEVVTSEGWLKTGDIARKDADGLFYIVGRKKEMIKVAGEIVFSPEVEAVLHRHPKVNEVAVIGIEDKLRGEVPKAFIVVKEQEQLAEDELRSFSKEHMAHFKIPHVFEFRSDLPKTLSGKINKEALKTV
ncbi:class I adenylate-forming enzyme family protein [Candidatus Omnitrophota bacterium]